MRRRSTSSQASKVYASDHATTASCEASRYTRKQADADQAVCVLLQQQENHRRGSHRHRCTCRDHRDTPVNQEILLIYGCRGRHLLMI